MLGNLITYLRHSLPRTEDSLSTLGEELERARAYLDILKIRMGARLHLQIEVPEALRRMPVPRDDAADAGRERDQAWPRAQARRRHRVDPGARTDSGVAVTVADDGRGFSAEGGGTGIGLRNVRERLRLAYGARLRFSIVANFPTGVAATITRARTRAAR